MERTGGSQVRGSLAFGEASDGDAVEFLASFAMSLNGFLFRNGVGK
jgi:hypothetical protein